MDPDVVAFWTVFDRSGNGARQVTVFSDNTAEILMEDVAYVTIDGEPAKLTSVDPDGGPRFQVGGRLRDYVITGIRSIEDDGARTVRVRVAVRRGRYTNGLTPIDEDVIGYNNMINLPRERHFPNENVMS